jgi:hypothetical protein
MPVLPTAPPVKPRKDEHFTDLAVIGVPAEYRDQFPQVVAYPSKFSDQGFALWKDLLTDPQVVSRLQSAQSHDAAWHMVIQEFLLACDEQAIEPIIGGTPTAGTTHLRDQVRRGRIYIVDYADRIGLFTKLRVQFATREMREYIRTDNGFIIYSYARMFPMAEPTLPQWLASLPMPRFIKHQRTRMVATIRPGVRLWVNCENLHRVYVGQEIDVPNSTIDIPGNRTPTRAEVDAFIDYQIWMPLVRSIKFDNIPNRLF